MTKSFSKEYKEDAVKLVIENHLKTSQVSKDLSIGKSTLEKWVKVIDHARSLLKGSLLLPTLLLVLLSFLDLVFLLLLMGCFPILQR